MLGFWDWGLALGHGLPETLVPPHNGGWVSLALGNRCCGWRVARLGSSWRKWWFCLKRNQKWDNGIWAALPSGESRKGTSW